MNQFDSRKITMGDTFFALPGQKVNGEQFIQEAALRGATHAVVSKGYKGDHFGLELSYVDDVLQELQTRAKKRLESWRPKVIGITGSVGKTTTKDFIATLLGEKYCIGVPQGSYNSQVTLPITILNFTGQEQVVVLELGMNQKGEMERLVEIASPEISIVTNVSHSHIGRFHSLDEIAIEKMKIFNSKNLRKAFVSNQAAHYAPAFAYTFGIMQGDHQLKREGNLIAIDDSPFFEFHLGQEHFLHNFLGACLVCREVGMQWSEIIEASSKLCPSKHRFERVEKGGVVYIDDSYNASVESTLSAFKSIPQVGNGGKKILVFGQMSELGSFSKEAHERVGAAATNQFEEAICLGEDCLPITEAFIKSGKKVWHFDNKDQVKEQLFERVKEGDVVLIKGANFHRLWEILE